MKSSARKSRAAAGQPFSAADRKKAADLASRIDPARPDSVLKFGAAVQAQVSQFQDRVLSHIQAKENRNVIEAVDHLLDRLKTLEINRTGATWILRKLRELRTGATSNEQYLSQFNKLSREIERQADELSGVRTQLLKDVELFEKLYEQNLTHLRNVSLRVRVLETKREQLEQKVVPKLQKAAEGNNDPLRALAVQDASDQVERLQRRIGDLDLTRTICVQAAGQIRMVEHDRQALAEKIVGATLIAVPLWKTQVNIAVARARQKETLRLHQRLQRATAALSGRNIAMLKRGGQAVARLSPRNLSARVPEVIQEAETSDQHEPTSRRAADAPSAKVEEREAPIASARPAHEGVGS